MRERLVTMKRAAGIGVLVLAVAALALVALWPEPPKRPARVASVGDLEQYLSELVRFGRPPGLSLVVVKDGRIAYGRAFGLADGPKHVAATPDTIYRWWSMTKIPTAVAILQLQERGLLSLDDPVSQHVPFFKVRYPSAASPVVRIRHLLNHSSGLPDVGLKLVRWLHLEGEPPVNQTAFVERVLPSYATLTFEPGSRTAYTNLGYMLLGAVIEHAARQTYEDYVREHVLRPLRMAHTDFIYTAAMGPDRAAGSHPLFNPWTPLLPLTVKHWGAFEREIDGAHLWFNTIYTDYTPSTGLIGCAPDVTRFLLAYLDGGELDGERILSGASIETMTRADRIGSRQAGSAHLRQGLGWVVDCGGRECLQHMGGGPGFGTAMRVYPRERLGVVVLTNDMTTDTATILDLAASLPWERGTGRADLPDPVPR
jgi:CubicO group peptidase (beta-lactamase class C family)